MGNEAQDLKIRISTPADTTGAEATAVSIDKVTKAAAQGNAVAKETTAVNQKATGATKETTKGLLEQGEAAEQAAGGARILTSALDGNVVELTKIGPILKSVRAAVSTVAGIWGILAVAAGAAIKKITDDLAKKRENQLKLEAEKTAVAFAAAQAAANRLNEQTTDAFQARLKAIETAATQAIDRVQRLVDIAAKLDDVEKATKLAAIDQDQSLTAEQKLDAKAEVNRGFAGRAEGRQRQVEDTQINAGQQTVDDTLKAEAAASRAAAAARDRADAMSGAKLLELMKPLERQLAEIQKANPGSDVQIPALNSLRDRFASTQSDEGKQRAGIAAAEAAAREADLKSAKDRQVAARVAQRELQQRIADERSGRTQIATAQATQDKRQYNLDLQKAREVDEAAAPRPVPKPVPLPVVPLVTNTGAPVTQPTAEDALRNRAGAVANVAGGIAANVANDSTQGDAMRQLAAQAEAASKAAEASQSDANITKAIMLMEDFATALAAIKQEAAKQAAEQAARLAKLQGDIRMLKR